MLEARSVAVVGASSRPGSFGERMIAEVAASPARPDIYLVNPRYAEIGGRQCHPSLADLPGPVDLVLLGVPDAALEEQLTLAATHGARAAVIFGNAHEAPAARPSAQDHATPDHPNPNPSPASHSGPNPSHPGLNPSAPGHPSNRSSTSSHSGPSPSDPPSRVDSGIGTEFPYRFPNRLGDVAGSERVGAGRFRAGQDGPAESPRPGLRGRLAAIASSAGMELCGAGCMGFVNVARGLRATGYIEPDPLPAGPVALVTHSGSVFSAMLRMRRGIGFTLAVSSGQELVTAAPSYLDYALGLPETRVLALVLEAIRQPALLRAVLATAAERDIPVVLLTVGNSARGAKMVAAHSGALAAADGGWEALARAYGVHRAGDLAELTDTLELFAIGRRAAPPALVHRTTQASTKAGEPPAADGRASPPDGARPYDRAGLAAGAGIATVHDSGLERAHAADLADQLSVPFAQISEATKGRLTELLDPGLEPGNPLDVWGTGADTQGLLASSLVALADDPAVAAVALAVDLVRELDGDDSYPLAVMDAARQTDKPLAVLSNLPSAIDQDAAARLRQEQIPVLEGLRSGLLALGHLLDHTGARSRYSSWRSTVDQARSHGAGPTRPHPAVDQASSPAAGPARPHSAADEASRPASGPGGAPLFDLLREYGISSATALPADTADAALTAAKAIGFPVVLKTDEPAIRHKSDARGVVLGVRGPAELAAAYADLAARLGPRVLVCETVPAGVELALGIVRDQVLGPLIVVGAGGVLVEVLADRVVALPPVDGRTAAELIGELRIASLLNGFRGAPPADIDSIVRAVTGLSALAEDLGDELEALDVNPLICGPTGAVAVDALAIWRASDGRLSGR